MNPFINPSDLIGPDDPWIVDGLDWSWAFVVYAEIPDGPGYRVGSNGSVWSCRTNHPGFFRRWKQIKGWFDVNGYVKVRLTIDGRSRDFSVHDLVLTAFIGNRPEGMVTRHFPDRTRSNNNSWNLHWGTIQENSDDKLTHGTMIQGSKSCHAKLTESDIDVILQAISRGELLNDVAARYGVHASQISRILADMAWKHVDGDRPKTKHYVRKLSDEDLTEMFRLHSLGWSMRKIANHLGINNSTVCRTLNGERNANARLRSHQM